MTQQLIDDCQKAYEAGSKFANNPANVIEGFPLWISTERQKEAYLEGYRDKREAKADALTRPLFPGCKVTILPPRESDKFTKAADCR